MLDLSCLDWRERIRAGRSLIPSIPLNEEEGRRAVAIFNMLRLPDVVGQPSMADAGADWFREIVATLFGAVAMVDGVLERTVREVFCLVPKKNSKTTNGAALMLTALLMNRRPRAEFLLVGPTQAVSNLAFGQAIGMIEADPEGVLRKRMHPREHMREIVDLRTKATLKIKTFDSSVLTGVKPVGVLVDELHEIAKSADAARVVGQLRGGLMPNPEAFLMFITTQSDTPPSGVFRDELMKARAVRDGRSHVAMLPVLYEFPEDLARGAPAGQDAPWYDASLWWMVTPNRDRSITIKRLAEEFETAKSVGMAEIVRWASQHLNIEIGVGLRSDRWSGADLWLDAAEPGLTFATLLERSEVVCVGIDGGGRDDLFAIAVLGREKNTRRWLVWIKAWALRSVLELRKSEASRFRDFEAAGDLVLVDELEIAFAEAADLVAEVDAAGLLARVGLDPMGVGMVVDALAERDIEGADRVVAVSQGWTLNGAIKTAEVKLGSGSLVHAGQGLMAWAIGNAKVEPKGNAITITKQIAGAGKIDPVMAMFDAVALMSRNPDATAGKPVYQVMFA